MLVSLNYVMGRDDRTKLLQKSRVFHASLCAGACKLICSFGGSTTVVLGAEVFGAVEGLQYGFLN